MRSEPCRGTKRFAAFRPHHQHGGMANRAGGHEERTARAILMNGNALDSVVSMASESNPSVLRTVSVAILPAPCLTIGRFGNAKNNCQGSVVVFTSDSARG